MTIVQRRQCCAPRTSDPQPSAAGSGPTTSTRLYVARIGRTSTACRVRCRTRRLRPRRSASPPRLDVRVVSLPGTGSSTDRVDSRAADATDPEAATDAAKGASVVYQCLNAPVHAMAETVPAAAARRIDRRGTRRCAVRHARERVRLRPDRRPADDRGSPARGNDRQGRTRAAMTRELRRPRMPVGSVSRSGGRRISSARASPSPRSAERLRQRGRRQTRRLPRQSRPAPHLQLRSRHRRRAGHPRHRRASGRQGVAPTRSRDGHHASPPRARRRPGRASRRSPSMPKLAVRALGFVNPMMRGLAEMAYEFERAIHARHHQVPVHIRNRRHPLATAIADDNRLVPNPTSAP